MTKKLFLIDAYALIFRSYYAFIGRPMRNGEGLNTSAIFGFTKFLRDIIANEKPHYLGVAFDPKGGNFRSQLYPLYKANREETPDDIIASVPYIKRIIEALRIPVLEVAGFEADDVIGTLAHKAEQEDFEVMMVTPDKDFGQLVSDRVKIYKQRKNGEGVEIVGKEQIREHYGFDDPRKVIDILALWGDASDNIPGIQGVGEKGAIKLVNLYGSAEGVVENADKLTPKLRENVLKATEQLQLSKELATIRLDVPIEFEPERLVMEQPDCQTLREIYKELDFRMFLRELESSAPSPFKDLICPAQPASTDQQKQAVATDLFGQPIVGKVSKPSVAAVADTANDLFGQPAIYATVADTSHQYITIETVEELERIVEQLRKKGKFCFDTETTGFDPYTDRLVGVSLSNEAHKGYWIRLDNGQAADFLAVLKSLLEDERVDKVGQNIKFDLMMLSRAGIRVRGFKYDTMLLHYLLNPESRHNMDYMAQTMLNYSPVATETLIGRGQKQLTMDRVPAERLAEYAAEDADITWQLYERLWPMIVDEGLGRLYRTIEEPLIDVLADMELTGVRVDSAQLFDYGRELSGTMNRIEREIREQCGMPDLNINSARQLGIALFEVLKITDKPKKTKTKQYATDEETLSALADRHKVVKMILDYRGLKKLISTYIDALPALVNSVTGHIHTSYNQAVTATGRLSSTNPNLQNIPVRDQQGRQIRKAFVASDDNHILLAADYSQVELRLMAHLSGDENMIEAFRNGEDIHRDTASRLFHVSPEQVTTEQRRKAKTANFGIIYGISAFGLRQRIEGISMGEAKEIIDGYFASYPKVKSYMERVTAEAHEKGYVETIFGRRRWLPDISSSNANVRSLAERNAINAPIQGSAADIIKLAMNEVAAQFESNHIRSKMILQVHDELVIDTLKEEADKVEQIVRSAMEGAVSLSVPLTVDIGRGQNWLEAH